MKKIFNKKDLAFWLGVILFICVLPMNYPMSKVEAAPWIDPPESATQYGDITNSSSITYNAAIDQVATNVTNKGGMTIGSPFWVTGNFENSNGGDLSVSGVLYAPKIVVSSGRMMINDGGIVNSDIVLRETGALTSLQGTLNGNVKEETEGSADVTVYGTLNGNMDLSLGSRDIDLQGATVNGNLNNNSGNLIVGPRTGDSGTISSTVKGNLVTNSGFVYIHSGGSVIGNVDNYSGPVNVDDSSKVSGTITCYSEDSNINVSGQAGALVLNRWQDDGVYISPQAIINTIEIKPNKEGVVNIGTEYYNFLPENTEFINHSGKDGLIVCVLDEGNEASYYFSVGNNQTFSYNVSTFDNLCKIEKDFGTVYTNDNSVGTFTLSNPLPNDLIYHIDKNSLYPFVLDATSQKGFAANQYDIDGEGKDYSNTDVYAVTVPANSSKEIKVSLADDYKDIGTVKKSVDDILVMIPDLNTYIEGSKPYTKLCYNNFSSYITVSADVEEPKEEPKEEPEVVEKKDGKGNITAPNVYYGKTPVVNITSNTNDASKASVLYTGAGYSSANVPTNPGTYTVTATLPENEEYKELVLTGSFTIAYLPAPNNAYSISGTKGLNGFYKDAVTINAPDGYTISTSLDGEYTNSIKLSDGADNTTIYYKNANGEMTDGVGIGEIKVDAKDPEVSSDSQDGNSTAIISVSDDNLDKIYVNGEEVSFTGTKKDIELLIEDLISEETFEIKAVDKAGRETTYTITLVSEWYQKGVIPKGAKVKVTKGKKMTLGDGATGVEGDSSVYANGITFYASEDGELTFK